MHCARKCLAQSSSHVLYCFNCKPHQVITQLPTAARLAAEPVVATLCHLHPCTLPNAAPLQIVAVLPEGGGAAKNPAYVCCKENALGLPEFCKQHGWELFVTADKDGKDSGGPHCVITALWF